MSCGWCCTSGILPLIIGSESISDDMFSKINFFDFIFLLFHSYVHYFLQLLTSNFDAEERE